MGDFREGCWAKVERANEHILDLNASIEEFLLSEPKPYRIVREKDVDGRAYVWKGFECRSVPVRIPVIVGEVAHQLRSSLDHLVVAMVLSRGNTVTAEHGFPISANRVKFNNKIKGRTVQGISANAIKIIESVQPYHAPNIDNSILWTLHTSDIEDKHRLLLVVGAAAFTGEVRIDSPNSTDPGGLRQHDIEFFQAPRRLTKGGEILLRATSADPEYDPNAKFTPLVAFEKFGGMEVVPVIRALSEARDHVVRIINSFAGEF